MSLILQHSLPPEMRAPSRLPGTAPAASDDWLRVDDAYAGQMARRIDLLETRAAEVLFLDPTALGAAREVLAQARHLLPGLGFEDGPDGIRCPDGRLVVADQSDPLGTLGRLVQEDICLMRKEGAEHVLVGAVLCFPASWRLAEKAGRPLVGIHAPVAEYDDALARRVQRLFDGVRVGRPLWRFNRLWYEDPELFQPRSRVAPRAMAGAPAPYVRSERQCILRMPDSDVCVFTIHTYVVRAGDA
ncbi:DUF3445 domain-containing protein [Sulfitobacter albidus]|uniref:DUF3445 domain-containing protein n=1 Tax=Sulfitobacter albidus TaxID=2829501 RepID=A0A975JF48_9RHOB|nr:DUF3445 domain-containing protein [Sulfitobacter albidus]QUJ77308.1 DUF3445 domain-containing protein [Sulfitobacter albidus]